jgi:hypothetical protein
MQQRPLSLSIIGWFMIAASAFGLLGLLFTMNNPVTVHIYARSPFPMPVHLAFGALGNLISIACGYGVLRGFNWSRFLYVAWSLIGFAFTLLTLPVATFIILGLAIFAVFVFFMFRPAANAWFKHDAVAKA